jgi:HlyD family secretion protein
MTRRTVFIIGALLAAGAGAAYYQLAAAPAPSLVTATVTRGSIVQAVEATGTVQPVDSVEVGAQVTGTIKTLGATFNSRVRRGQVLATLDPAAFQAQVDQARAGMQRLEAELQQSKVAVEDATVKLARAERLATDQLIPQQDFDTARLTRDSAQAALKSAQAQVVQARASLAQSEVNLQHTVITSPVDGIVLSRNVEIGQTVTSGLQTPTLFVIARDLGTMQVSASVDESDTGRVSTAQPVTFTLDAYAGETFTGRVTEVRLQPVVSQNVVTYTTIITVPNPQEKLKPGMTATVRIETGRADNTLRVPTAALRFRPDEEVFAALDQELPKQPWRSDRAASGGSTRGAGTRANAMARANAPSNPSRPATITPGGRAVVWLMVNGKLQPQRVTLGISDGSQVAVVADSLQEGAQVVTGVRQSSKTASNTSSSPLMPSMPRRSSGRGL